MAKDATPEQIGMISSAFWLGILLGLLVTGQLTRTLGYRITIIIGLVVSALSFALMPLTCQFAIGWLADNKGVFRYPNYAL